MGMLFVHEGDEQAVGEYVDLSMHRHSLLMDAARKASGAFPLVRRVSDFYRDASFERDEIAGLVGELRLLVAAGGEGQVADLLDLCRTALDAGVGVEVIAD